MRKNYSSLIIGLVFILIGAGLLLDRLDTFRFGWTQIYPIIFLLISISSFLAAAARQKNSAFWGGIFAVLGLFFVLRNFDVIPYYWFPEYWPIFLIALGFGFIILYIFEPRDWGVLIPGVIFLALGVLFILGTMDLLENVFENFADIMFTYWPLVLVLVGLLLILNSVRHKEVSENDKSLSKR